MGFANACAEMASLAHFAEAASVGSGWCHLRIGTAVGFLFRLCSPKTVRRTTAQNEKLQSYYF